MCIGLGYEILGLFSEKIIHELLYWSDDIDEMFINKNEAEM